MFNMTIRKAKTADLPVLASFDTVTSGLDRRVEEIKTATLQGRCWVYADGAAPPSGYAIFDDNFFGRPCVRLVYVAPDSRRRGVGSQLISHLEKLGGQDRIFTSANQNNEAMRALLTRLGYQQCGEIHAIEDKDPELVFVRYLGG